MNTNTGDTSSHATGPIRLKDRLMEQLIRQEYPVPPRNLFWFGIH